MTRTIAFTIIALLLGVAKGYSQTGQWRAYLSYHEPTEIEAAGGNTLYVLASKGLYAYNKADQSLQTLDKTNALTDCGIAHIAWCQAAKRLVVVYDNGNIDLLGQSGEAVNIADYMNKTMTTDKTVYAVDVVGTTAYLSTGFGIVRLNVANATIADTYQLGFRVDYAYEEASHLYAASSSNGLYRAPLAANLLDRANWQRVGEFAARPKTMDADQLALVNTLAPGGPKYNHFGFMRMVGGKLYTVGGGYPPGDDYALPGCVQVLDGTEWTTMGDDVAEKTGRVFVDLNSVDVDPTNPSRVLASGRTGLYEFRDGTFVKDYNPANSALQGAATVSADSKDYCIVQGITFDASGNLWALNSISATTSLLQYDTEGQWTSHHKSALMANGYSLARLDQPFMDSRGLLWFVNNHWTVPSLYAYQPSTGGLNAYTSITNEDGTVVNMTYAHCAAEDRESNIWLGTNAGPVYLAPSQIAAESPVFTQVKVPRRDGTNYADYLLAGIDVTAIAIDRANRKWFGTSGSGVYLISADNLSEVYHFTAANSPLLSDYVQSVAINDATGEVFFGTDKGLCSYMSNTLTAGDGMTKDNVYAYPNPVRPDYTGPITITGLDEDADVKIVTVNGTLVAEGRASSGQYKWYGLDRAGRRVASGVYMVEVATAEGEKGVVCKVAIVR